MKLFSVVEFHLYPSGKFLIIDYVYVPYMFIYYWSWHSKGQMEGNKGKNSSTVSKEITRNSI